MPKPRTAWARAGIRYELNVVKALALFVPVLHNPWYVFEDDHGASYISPDIVLPYDSKLIVAECKLTYKPEAIVKLRRLYCPIIAMATEKPVLPLVITKNLNPSAPEPGLALSIAIGLAEPLLHWTGKGSIGWGIASAERSEADGDASELASGLSPLGV